MWRDASLFLQGTCADFVEALEYSTTSEHLEESTKLHLRSTTDANGRLVMMSHNSDGDGRANKTEVYVLAIYIIF